MIPPPNPTKHKKTVTASAKHMASQRIAAGMTQCEFAAAIGKSVAQVRRYEDGTTHADYPTQYIAEAVAICRD